MVTNRLAQKHLVSAASGDIISLKDIPDKKYASGMYGDGYAVKPANGMIYSPCDGIVTNISENNNEYTIAAIDGLSIMVHIGLKGFAKTDHVQSYVSCGEGVTRGQIIARIYPDAPSYLYHDTITPVIIKNIEKIKDYSIKKTGRLEGGKSITVSYRL